MVAELKQWRLRFKRIQSAECKVQSAECKVQSAKCRMQNGQGVMSLG